MKVESHGKKIIQEKMDAGWGLDLKMTGSCFLKAGIPGDTIGRIANRNASRDCMQSFRYVGPEWRSTLGAATTPANLLQLCVKS